MFINEEFNECAKEPETVEPTDELMGCLNVLRESKFDIRATVEDAPWYTDSSTLFLQQYGIYTGRNSIAEYLRLNGDLFSDLCIVQDTSTLVDFVPEAGYCDVTFGYVVQTSINPSVTSYTGLIEVLVGYRLQYPMPTDPKLLELHQTALFYPNDFMKRGLSDVYDLPKAVNRVCTIMQNNCTDVFQANGYHTLEDCTEELALLPRRVETPDGVMYDDGNSTGCRILHSFLARENAVHCPHISYAPMEDVNGKTKCSESAYLDAKDYFSEASFEGLERIKEKYGFDDNRPYSLVEESEAGQCATFSDDLRESLMPSTCEMYVRAQKSTDSFRNQYWGIMIGMFFALRIIGMILLKMRAKSF